LLDLFETDEPPSCQPDRALMFGLREDISQARDRSIQLVAEKTSTRIDPLALALARAKADVTERICPNMSSRRCRGMASA